MKPYHILKPFNGSQTGNDFQQFAAGTTEPLSDELAAVAVGQGWAKPVAPEAPVPGPATRETKVTGPDETKPAKALGKMTKAELSAHGLALGLAPFPDTATAKDMIAAIEAHPPAPTAADPAEG